MLNLAVIIPSKHIYKWQKDAIHRIKELSFVKLQCVIITDIKFRKLSIPYAILNKLDQLPYNLESNSLEVVSLEEQVRFMHLACEGNDPIGLNQEEEEQLGSLNLDLLINLNPRPLSSAFNKFNKFGIWEVKISDSTFGGFKEVINNEPVTKVSIVSNALANFGNKIIYESYSSTERYSILKNWNNLFWKVGTLISRGLKNLEAANDKAVFFNNLKQVGLLKPQSLPTAFDAINGLSKQLPKILKKFIDKKLNFQQWFVLIRHKNDKEFKNLYPPKGHIWADPFVIEHEDRVFVFVEETDPRSPKGYITVIELNKKLEIQNIQKEILKPNYHLSYPCIFEVDGVYYMIPESFENNTIQLYRCESFPTDWKFERNLMEGVKAFDATPFFYNNLWYLFVSIMEYPGDSHSDELFIFYTKDILNPDWKRHAQNPVISDVRKARPAGKIFYKDDKIIRPSQDGAKEYGYAINLNEIIRLSPEEYEEKQLEYLSPNPEKGVLRKHTFNTSENYEVQDGFRLIK